MPIKSPHHSRQKKMVLYDSPTEGWLRPIQKLAPISLCFLPAESSDQWAGIESGVCSLIHQAEQGCGGCRKTDHSLRQHAITTMEPKQAVCPRQLALFAVPVVKGKSVVGVIEGGRVFTTRPDERTFLALCGQLGDELLAPDLMALRARYFETAFVPPEQLRAIIELLHFISGCISSQVELAANDAPNCEPPQIARARRYIEQHLTEKLTISEMARVACISEDYFSKLFKRTTGMAFTEYVTAARIRSAQRALTNSSKQISEVAYECGFDSISHFNRMFKRYAGVPPKQYRIRAAGRLGNI